MINKIDKYRYSNMPLEKINDLFINACKDGDLELVKYFLTDKKIVNAEIDCNRNKAMIEACHNKHNDVVKYLLTGKELKKHISIHINKGSLLSMAVGTNNIELMEYLLENGKSKKMHLNQNDDVIFKSLVSSFNYSNNSELLKSLIMDYDLKKTQEIINFLDEKNRSVEEKKLVNEWFEKRDLKQGLQYVYEEKNNEEIIKPKRNKI